jgi:hypothetical protein
LEKFVKGLDFTILKLKNIFNTRLAHEKSSNGGGVPRLLAKLLLRVPFYQKLLSNRFLDCLIESSPPPQKKKCEGIKKNLNKYKVYLFNMKRLFSIIL